MAVTNAISGLTAVGGMSLLAHSQADSIIPNSGAGWAGAVALTLSCVNIVGGFTVSGKMLDLFRRPEVGMKRCFTLLTHSILTLVVAGP